MSASQTTEAETKSLYPLDIQAGYYKNTKFLRYRIWFFSFIENRGTKSFGFLASFHCNMKLRHHNSNFIYVNRFKRFSIVYETQLLYFQESTENHDLFWKKIIKESFFFINKRISKQGTFYLLTKIVLFFSIFLPFSRLFSFVYQKK